MSHVTFKRLYGVSQQLRSAARCTVVPARHGAAVAVSSPWLRQVLFPILQMLTYEGSCAWRMRGGLTGYQAAMWDVVIKPRGCGSDVSLSGHLFLLIRAECHERTSAGHPADGHRLDTRLYDAREGFYYLVPRPKKGLTLILVMKTAVRRRLSRWVWRDYDSFFFLTASLFYSFLLNSSNTQCL